MITILIGDWPSKPLSEVLSETRSIKALYAEEEGSLARYARACTQSCKTISKKDPITDEVTRKKANDPMTVVFGGISANKYPKLSAYIELAQDFNLDIRVIVYHNYMLPKFWPAGWPTPQRRKE